VNIRQATPGDSAFLAWVILAAQRGHLEHGFFDIALGGSERECLAFAQRLITTTVRSWWHASTFLIAEIDGQPAAALCALGADEASSTFRPAVDEACVAAGFPEDERAALWRRGGYAGTCWMPGDGKAWVIEHVATKRAHRGRGLVQRLLERALVDGRGRGFTTAQITFYIGNRPAERSYVRAGFTFAEERRHPDFEAATGSPGFCRYVREI
jgi:ribosomal protein S18 acetylase RimI-like enzyme